MTNEYTMTYALLLTGCASPFTSSTVVGGGGSMVAAATESAKAAHDPVLAFVSAACLLAGVAALVITRGKVGGRAVAVGLGLVVLNYVLAYFAAWLFIPVLVATGAISLAYAYKTVRNIIASRKAATE